MGQALASIWDQLRSGPQEMQRLCYDAASWVLKRRFQPPFLTKIIT